MVKKTRAKLLVLSATIALTVAIHYGWVLPYLFGHTSWVHAVHSRFCYIPIAIAAAWFGLRGGLISATAISMLVLPFVLMPNMVVPSEHFSSLSSELVEIFFYYVFGFLIGWLVDRELLLRKRHEKAQLQLEHSKHLAVVGQMAAGVAHEIKNPLASIKGAVEIVGSDATLDQDKREFQAIISKEIKRIDGTVKEFLEYARPRPAQLSNLNLSSVLESTIRQISAMPECQAVRFNTNIQPEVIILGDADKLHQAFLNLILNAVQASPRESEVSIQLHGGSSATLTIRDHGKGIAPEHLSRIFEPFYTTKPTGTGLGLAIVNEIIKEHSGGINVTSDNFGTTFTISLPTHNGSRR